MILVFGGNGQLAKELARASAQQGISLKALPKDVAYISDPASVRAALNEYKPALLINAAAYTSVDQAEVQIDAAQCANTIGPAVVAAACEAADVPVLHISTDYVFDGTKAGPYVEDDPIAPLGAYGRTKAAGENAVRQAARKHVIIRTAWLYGEFGHNFLKTIVRLAQERDELRIVADQRGCPTSTRDLAGAILGISGRLIARRPVWGTYHFAGAGVATWYEFAARIVDRQAPLTGHRPKVTPIATRDYPTRAERPANSTFDCSLFESTFGIQPRSWLREADDLTNIVVKAQHHGECADVA
jgi:dTDP-4-dehydrorhamnose reductase